MPPLLPIGNRREVKTRGVVLQDDSGSDYEAEDGSKDAPKAGGRLPTGGKTAKASGNRLTVSSAGSGPSFLRVPQAGSAAASPQVSPGVSSQPSPVVTVGAPRVVRVVRFAATPSNQVVEVTPYSQVYGMDPAKFDFDPSAPNGIEWHGTPGSSPDASPPGDATGTTGSPVPRSLSMHGAAIAPSQLTRQADGTLVAPPVYVTPPRSTPMAAQASR